MSNEMHVIERWIAGLSVVTMATIALGACSSAERTRDTSYACEGERTLVLDLSSQNRSPDAVASAEETLTAHLLGAAICKENVSAVAVAGGSVTSLFDEHTAVVDTIDGPNVRARKKQARGVADDARVVVADQIEGAFEAFPEVRVTSMPAMYAAAAEHAAPGERVVLLTTGVNIDDQLDLNRALAPDEGALLAGTIRVTKLPADTDVVVIGVGRMDADAPVPGATWTEEIHAFNQAVCEATDAACQVFTVASVEESRP